MLIRKILKIIILLLGVAYVFFQSFALEIEGDGVGTLAFILLTYLYLGWTEHRSILFSWFLIVFTSAQIVSFIVWFTPKITLEQTDYLYYIANMLCIVSYVLLIVKMFIHFNIKAVFSQLAVPTMILVVLDIFCVTLISNTTENVFSYYEYILEFFYNAVIMLLLSIALINYMYRNNNKSMLFLIGAIFMVFSEVIQLAYFYILDINILGFVYSTFLVVAFSFFYIQSQYTVTDPVTEYSDDNLDVL
ncbi:hypothetical protein [Winogradskyella undariae]|uniref:hypothetical protein n=1 Tax=Winogradskyella undariae TaxID=1285465 RepID=UPI0015CB0F41|nr:hypothetical protein [Winogradskyella undariae]